MRELTPVQTIVLAAVCIGFAISSIIFGVLAIWSFLHARWVFSVFEGGLAVLYLWIADVLRSIDP